MKNDLFEPYLDSIEIQDLLSFWRMTIKRINKQIYETEFSVEFPICADENSAISDIEMIANICR